MLPRRRLPLIAPVFLAFSAVAAFAKLEAPDVSALTAWRPPFQEVNATFVSDLQALGKVGFHRGEGIQPIGGLADLKPESELDRRALGALLGKLPAGFEARLHAAMAEPDRHDMGALADDVLQARDAASPEVLAAAARRAVDLAAFLKAGADADRISDAVSALRPLGFYGGAVHDVLGHLEDIASEARAEPAMQRAKELADTLSGHLSPQLAALPFGGTLSVPRRGPLLTTEELNLTPEHYDNARRLHGERFSLKPARPVEPTLESGEKTQFKVGDTVKLGLPAFYSRDPDNRLWKSPIEGRIERLIYDGDALVGLLVQRPDFKHVDGVHTPPRDVVWLNDVDPDDARVVSRPARPGAAGPIDVSAMPEPETTFPILFKFGGDRAAPLAVGDGVSFEFKERNGEKILVSGRGPHGRRVEAILRDGRGNPVGFKFEYDRGDTGDCIYPYDRSRIDATGLVSVYFDEIIRGRGSPFIDTSWPQYLNFRFPLSRVRLPWVGGGYSWLPSFSAALRTVRDSGEFTLRVSERYIAEDMANAVQCPVAVGDNVVLCLKRPDSLRGCDQVGYRVLDVLKRRGRTLGFRVEYPGSGDPTTVIGLEDVYRDDSYIDMRGRPGGASRIPGAWSRRAPFVAEVHEGPREDFDAERFIEYLKELFFGRASRSSRGAAVPKAPKRLADIEPWTTAPIGYDEWVVRLDLQRGPASEALWARWALQVSERASKAEIKKSLRALYKRFHPDMAAVNGVSGSGLEALAKHLGHAGDVLLKGEYSSR